MDAKTTAEIIALHKALGGGGEVTPAQVRGIVDAAVGPINAKIPAAATAQNQLADKGFVNDKFNGANKAIAYDSYQTMITAFNALAATAYSVGQNVYIVTMDVPDLWISAVESTSVPYTYTTDAAFVADLAADGYVQVGYYRFSALETQKVDLTDVVSYTTQSKSDSEKAQARSNIDAQRNIILKTTIGSTADVNTMYFLGERTSVSIATPTTAAAGDMFTVIFYSGATPATLSVTSVVVGDVPTPQANQRVELSFLFDGTHWSLLSSLSGVSA